MKALSDECQVQKIKKKKSSNRLRTEQKYSQGTHNIRLILYTSLRAGGQKNSTDQNKCEVTATAASIL